MAGERKIRIYRKTNPGDTYAGLASTEKLEFNASKTITTPNGHTIESKIIKGRDIAENPDPQADLSESQDTGLGETVYQLVGTISRSDDITNSFLVNIENWSNESQESNAMPFGRFAIELDRAPLLNILANASVGLKFTYVEYLFDEDIPNALQYIIRLTKAKVAS